jgi:hypothetical protein
LVLFTMNMLSAFETQNSEWMKPSFEVVTTSNYW